ncbi:MAG: host attachment protein [Thiolinea sp.]
MRWIVVANTAKARIFSAEDASSNWVEEQSLIHPASAMKVAELRDDEANTTFRSERSGRDLMEPSTDPKAKEADIFAREVRDCLEENRRNDKFHRLYLVAAPAFLGMLRPLLSKEVRDKVVVTVDKNLVEQDVAGIRRHLPGFAQG